MTQTNAQRRQRGLRRLEVWVPEETIERLDVVCEDSGYTRGDQLAAMVDAEWARLEKR